MIPPDTLLAKDFFQVNRAFFQEGFCSCQDPGNCPAAFDPARFGRGFGLDALNEMLQFVDVTPDETFRPGAGDRGDQPLVAVGADDHRLPLQVADLHDALLADDLGTGVVTISAGAHAGDQSQATAFELDVDQHVIVEVGGHPRYWQRL